MDILNRHCTSSCIPFLRPTVHLWDYEKRHPEVYARGAVDRYEVVLGYGHWSGSAWSNRAIVALAKALMNIRFEGGVYCNVSPSRWK